MKRCRIAGLCMTVCLVLGMVFAPVTPLNKVQAAEVLATVSGTIQSGTTAELLKLSTKEGSMEIKLDSSTDTSACKILLPNKKIDVSVAGGTDGYLHAVRITGEGQSSGVTIDTGNITVSGTVDEKSDNSLLYFKTSQGEMQIKLDATTNMSGCAVLVANKTYTITCARGSDAYLHALTITDPTVAAPVVNSAATASVTGTVNDRTRDDLLYLSTSGGEMQFKIDSGTDTTNGRVLTPGRQLTVGYYRGSDAYLHAATIVGARTNLTKADVGNTATMTVEGTVEGRSTEDMLYLKTDGGTMEIKMDTVPTLNNCKVLTSGKKVTVTCARGSDAYQHATAISGTSMVSAPAGNTAATASVTGTVSDRTKEDVLYLSTKGGEMQFKIDSNADTSKGMIVMPGRQLTVGYYHGSDSWLHAVTITGVKDIPIKVDINTSSQLAVEGTVKSDSDENLLRLSTSGGDMELKLDAVNSLNNCKILVSGKRVSVNCARGSDAYLHAIDITGK